MRTKISPLMLLGALFLIALAGCSSGVPGLSSGPRTTLRIVSGSENETLEPILQDFAKNNNMDIQMTYKGSIDISMFIGSGSNDYDAVWPANSLWITLGDTQHRVKDEQSIMRSPVVLGIKKSLAQQFGWIGKDVRVQDILQATQQNQIRLLMTNGTQSNSGASAYFGFLYAFAGSPDVLTSANLNDANVRDQVRAILSKVNRSSQSSGFLRNFFLKNYDQYDAMFNYESLVIEMNQSLAQEGKEPLYVIYPTNGLAIADSPLAFINSGDAQKEQAFLKLQQYMLSDAVQKQILAKGRRTGLVGLTPDQVDKGVFNPNWGIDVSRVLSPIKFPAPAVIQEALDLYQTALRKPSFTVYALDFSGSMGGNGGEQQLKEAMRTLLDQQTAQQYLLQAAPDDVNIVLTFNSDVINRADVNDWTVRGNNPTALSNLLGKIEGASPGGNTNIYAPVALAFDLMKQQGTAGHFPAVILMTDGQSNHGSMDEINAALDRDDAEGIPVFAITFGDASTDQLKEITDLTNGAIYDGTKDLVTAFRNAKGNN